jgi:transposase
MRGQQTQQTQLFSYIPLESRIPAGHPLRRIREMVDEILSQMSGDFERLYSHTGRPSIPPEQLLKALFLQILYTIRSEGQLIEHLQYNMLYRWFVGIDIDERAWDESVFTKNRDRLLRGKVADRFFNRVVELAASKNLISRKHFAVDGTLIEAWASLKSFVPKGETIDDQDKDDDDPGNPGVNFKGEARKNDTHQSATDPESKLYTKGSGQTAKLNYMGHALMENRNGLAVGGEVTEASFHAEHHAAIDMLKAAKAKPGSTVAGDKHYDNHRFCEQIRGSGIAPHVAQNIHSRRHYSAVDGRTTRHPGYEVSLRKRKRVEEIFGWLKTIGLFRRIHLRGKQKVRWLFKFALSVYNLVRISNLEAANA